MGSGKGGAVTLWARAKIVSVDFDPPFSPPLPLPGVLAVFCRSLLDHLDRLPGDARTMVGLLTFDSSLHFYSFPVRICACIANLPSLCWRLP